MQILPCVQDPPAVILEDKAKSMLLYFSGVCVFTNIFLTTFSA